MSDFSANYDEYAGWVVKEADLDWANGFLSVSSICNFGEFRADAERFLEDINNGLITKKQLERMSAEYTDQPYEYLGRGKIRKQ